MPHRIFKEFFFEIIYGFNQRDIIVMEMMGSEELGEEWLSSYGSLK